MHFPDGQAPPRLGGLAALLALLTMPSLAAAWQPGESAGPANPRPAEVELRDDGESEPAPAAPRPPSSFTPGRPAVTTFPLPARSGLGGLPGTASGSPGTALIDDERPPQAQEGATLKGPPAEEAAARPAEVEASDAPPRVETATFNGMQPGVSTVDELRSTWGAPDEVRRFESHEEHTYRQEPFERITVALEGGRVATIVIHLKATFPCDAVARQLDLVDIEPVLVRNDADEVLGQAFPERGVLFSFEPLRADHRVAEIILQPVQPEAFVLRAETRLRERYEASLSDLEIAVALAPDFARAHWLRAQLLAALERHAEALEAADEAVRLDPKNGDYRLGRAKALEQLGQIDRAAKETEAALRLPGVAGVTRARGLCQLADLELAGPARDYQRAVGYRLEAIQVAEPLVEHPKAAVRRAAREVLLDAHLGIGHDIAWGGWKRKGSVVPKWLAQGERIAREALAAGEGEREWEFRVARLALSAHSGMQAEAEPGPWVEAAAEAGRSMIAATSDRWRKRQLQRQLGLAHHDALQAYHARGETEAALRSGRSATEYLEQGGPDGLSTADKWLLARVYFRMGAVYSILQGEHAAACAWFDKSLACADNLPADQLDAGRQGESLTTMAVSYWETGRRQQALKLTQEGLRLMEEAVKQGLLAESALAVPYGNLATMHEVLGDAASAEKFAQRAYRSQARSAE